MQFSTPDLCDDNADAVRVCEPLFAQFGGRAQFCGQIVTIKCHEDNSLVKAQADLDGTGKVMIVDGGGSLRRALLGDMIAQKAQDNGWQGFIIFGCVRDVDVLASLDLGVKALRAMPLKTEKRGEGQLNIPITFAGVTFRPDEFVYADNNGVVVSAQALL